MPPIAHPERLLKREIEARDLTANRLALDLGVPSGRITNILNGLRGITTDSTLRLGRYFGHRAQFWPNLQSQYDIAVVNHGGKRSRALGPVRPNESSLGRTA
jgi:addiction module HigA family antidote